MENSTLYASNYTYAFEKARIEGYGDEDILEQAQKIGDFKIPYNLEYLDDIYDESTGTSATAFKDKNTGEVKTLNVDALFVAIGQIPMNQIFSDIVDLDEYGFIKADEECRTSVKGIYAAGDCRVKTVRQLTTAASDGAIAALNACNNL